MNSTIIEKHIEAALQKGLRCLKNRQQANGSFECMTAESINCFNEAMEVFEDGDKRAWIAPDKLLVFPSLLTGMSLLFLKEYEDAEIILGKLTKFVLANRRFGNVWNHYQKEHPFYKVMPFDIDDTACALGFLRERGMLIKQNEKMILPDINRSKLLYSFYCLRFSRNSSIFYWLLACRELLYPIQTKIFWRVVEADRYDIDGIMNANVLTYMGKCKKTEHIIQYLLDSVLSGQEGDIDKWYRNPFVIYYFISKNYFVGIQEFEKIKPIIVGKIQEQFLENGSIRDNALDTSLALCTMSNFKINLNPFADSVQYLLNIQKVTGAWEKRVVYTGGPKLIMGFGSEELTTSFCLEALNRYKKNLG